MAIAASDIKFYKPSVPTEGATHGGTSTVNEIAVTKNALWDDVSGDEASAGDTEFRKVFIGLDPNAAAQILSSPVVFVATTTPADDEIEIKTLTIAADSDNAMSDISDGTDWGTPTAKSDGVSLENITSDVAVGVWLRRNVPAATSAYADNSFTLQVEGETV